MNRFIKLIFGGVIVCSCTITKGQTKEFSQSVAKQIQLHLIIPDSLECDSCYRIVSFLQVKFNEQAEFQSMGVADNAENWLKNEVKRIASKMNPKRIDSIARDQHYKNAVFLFPIIIQSKYFPCQESLNVQSNTLQQKFYLFNSSPITGPVIYGEKIEYIYTRPKSCDK